LYLKKQKELRTNFETVSKALLEKGWDEKIVEEAGDWYVKTEKVTTQSLSPQENQDTGSHLGKKPEIEQKVEEVNPLMPDLGAEKVEKASSENPYNNINNDLGSLATPAETMPANETNYNYSTTHHQLSVLKIIIIILIPLILLSILSVGIMAAYEKIKLPFLSQDLQTKLSQTVISLPFMPKTPKYVLMASQKAHESVSSAEVSLSAAFTSVELAQLTGSGNFDISLDGSIDFTDRKNPETSINLKVNNDLDADFVVKDKFVYFKINKLPPYLPLLLGPNVNLSSLLNTWVSYDASGLETDARNSLDMAKEENGQTADQLTEQALMAFADERLVPKMVMTDDNVDGFNTYKIHIDMDGTDIQEFQKVIDKTLDTPKYATTVDETSQVFKSVKVDIWIDKENYYMRKMAAVVTIDPNIGALPLVAGASTIPGFANSQLAATPGTSNPIDFAIAVKLSKIGEKFDIKSPQDFIDVEEFSRRVSSIMYNTPYGGGAGTTPNPDDYSGFE